MSRDYCLAPGQQALEAKLYVLLAFFQLTIYTLFPISFPLSLKLGESKAALKSVMKLEHQNLSKKVSESMTVL